MVKSRDTFIVLNDGETFTSVNGCKVVIVKEEYDLDAADLNIDIQDLIKRGKDVDGLEVIDLSDLLDYFQRLYMFVKMRQGV